MSAQQRTHKYTAQPLTPKPTPYALALLPTANAQAIYLRDGEVVLYRRSRSLLYQCRYKLADGTWYRQSTRKASIEHAVAVACDLYDEARYQPPSMNGTFRRLMRDTGLLKNTEGQTRTLDK